MNNLTLLNYFEAIRTGRASTDEVLEDIKKAVLANPQRYHQILHWLDKAQHWSPLTNDQFVSLRRQVKSFVEQPTVETGAQTVPNPIDPTLLAARPAGPQPSRRSVPSDRLFGWAFMISGIVVVLGGWWWFQPSSINQAQLQQVQHGPIERATTERQTVAPDSTARNASPASAIHMGSVGISQSPSYPRAGELTNAPFSIQAPAKDWFTEIKRRAAVGRLVPASDTQSAAYLIAHMEDRFPSSEITFQANQWFRQACVDAAEQARSKRDWQQAQLLLDSAFRELQARVEE